MASNSELTERGAVPLLRPTASDDLPYLVSDIIYEPLHGNVITCHLDRATSRVLISRLANPRNFLAPPAGDVALPPARVVHTVVMAADGDGGVFIASAESNTKNGYTWWLANVRVTDFSTTSLDATELSLGQGVYLPEVVIPFINGYSSPRMCALSQGHVILGEDPQGINSPRRYLVYNRELACVRRILVTDAPPMLGGILAYASLSHGYELYATRFGGKFTPGDFEVFPVSKEYAVAFTIDGFDPRDPTGSNTNITPPGNAPSGNTPSSKIPDEEDEIIVPFLPGEEPVEFEVRAAHVRWSQLLEAGTHRHNPALIVPFPNPAYAGISLAANSSPTVRFAVGCYGQIAMYMGVHQYLSHVAFTCLPLVAPLSGAAPTQAATLEEEAPISDTSYRPLLDRDQLQAAVLPPLWDSPHSTTLTALLPLPTPGLHMHLMLAATHVRREFTRLTWLLDSAALAQNGTWSRALHPFLGAAFRARVRAILGLVVMGPIGYNAIGWRDLPWELMECVLTWLMRDAASAMTQHVSISELAERRMMFTSSGANDHFDVVETN